MPIRSTLPDVHIPQVNVLDYLFPNNTNTINTTTTTTTIDNQPLWADYKDSTKSLSASQAVQWIKRLGAGLQHELGLARGDVVMMCSTNHIFVPIAYLGIVGATCIFTGANPAYTAKEIAHQITNAQPKIILVHPSKLHDVLDAVALSGFSTDCVFSFSDNVSGNVAALPRDSDASCDGIRDWTFFLPAAGSDAAVSWSWPALSPPEARTTIATINYSSGTTGLPKGVCISHYNLVADVQQILGARHPTELNGTFSASSSSPCSSSSSSSSSSTNNKTEKSQQDVCVAFLPLYHAYGQMYTILVAARRRSTVFLMPVFGFDEYLAAIARHRATAMHVVPPVVVMLAKRPDAVAAHDLSSVCEISCGAAPLRRDLQNEVARRLGVELRQAWGMTELTCAGSAMPVASGGGEAGGGKQARSISSSSSTDWNESGSCGKLLPNMQARFLDDKGNEVGPGEPGELFVKGPNVMMGYWRNESATRDTLDADGWLRTGDVAVYNEEGMLWIVDRKKELIKVNGLQVAPAELEALLLENEHVADAAVVGITLNHEEYPRAYVHIQDTSKATSNNNNNNNNKIQPRDIQDWVAARVAKHKRLVGGVCFVDAVPKLTSGKIVRKLLREWAKRDAVEMEKAGWTRPRL